MDLFKTYSKGFQSLFRFPQIWIRYYAINVLIALLAAIPVFQYLDATLGNTVVLTQLLEQFDFRIITDILNKYGLGLSPLFNQSFFLVLAFLLLAALLMGGIIATFSDDHLFEKNFFWGKCFSFFGRILRLAGLFFGIHILAFLLFWFTFQYFAQGMSPDKLESETTVITALRFIGIPYLFVAAIIAMIHDYAKVILVQNDFKVIPAFKQGVQFCLVYFGQTFFLMLLHTILFCLLFYFYKKIDMVFDENTGLKVLLFFVISQFFIFIRIGMKLWNLANVSHFYNMKN